MDSRKRFSDGPCRSASLAGLGAAIAGLAATAVSQAAVTVTQVNAGSEGAERNLYYAGNYGSTNLYNGDFIDPNFKVFNVTENRSSDTT